jgi:hypothetical protein
MLLRDKDLHDSLEKAGFRLDFGDDDSGQFKARCAGIPTPVYGLQQVHPCATARWTAPTRPVLPRMVRRGR